MLQTSPEAARKRTANANTPHRVPLNFRILCVAAGPISPHPGPLPRRENSPKNSRIQPLNPIVVGRVCPERAASILHPRPGALGTDAPYLEVHGEGKAFAVLHTIEHTIFDPAACAPSP